MPHPAKRYLPAAGRDWALPLYDPLVKLLGADAARASLLDRAGIRPGDRILDIGCGTGTFAARIKSRHPESDVIGLDPDPLALARARRKAARAGADIRFDQGFSDDPPYERASFERVFSTFMFHHLSPEDKKKTLAEVRRVLAPRGSFHLLDFLQPETPRMIELLGEAGFVSAASRGRGGLFFGLLRTAAFEASVPASEVDTLRA